MGRYAEAAWQNRQPRAQPRNTSMPRGLDGTPYGQHNKVRWRGKLVPIVMMAFDDRGMMPGSLGSNVTGPAVLKVGHREDEDMNPRGSFAIPGTAVLWRTLPSFFPARSIKRR